VDALREQFENMRRNADDAQRSRGQAEDLRKRARDLLEGMSPEERDELRRWMAEQQRENATPFDQTETVDARRADEDGSGNLMGEFDDPNMQPLRPGEEGAISRRETAQRILENLRSSQGASEERTVPRERSAALERYFRRALERLREREAAGEAPAPEPAPTGPSQDAPDVK